MKISKTNKTKKCVASKNMQAAKAKLIEAADLITAEISASGSVEAKEILNDLAVVIFATDAVNQK